MPGLFLCSRVVFGHKLKDASFQPMVLSDRCRLVQHAPPSRVCPTHPFDPAYRTCSLEARSRVRTLQGTCHCVHSEPLCPQPRQTKVVMHKAHVSSLMVRKWGRIRWT